MKLNVLCVCRLTKDSLLPWGDWSCNRETSQGKSGLIPFAQKEEWLEVAKWFSCKSGVSEPQVVEAELYWCSPTTVWEVLQSPQLTGLVGAKCCCFRAGFGHRVLGLTGERWWWWDLHWLPRTFCPVSCFCAFPGLWTTALERAELQPLCLWGGCITVPCWPD